MGGHRIVAIDDKQTRLSKSSGDPRFAPTAERLFQILKIEFQGPRGVKKLSRTKNPSRTRVFRWLWKLILPQTQLKIAIWFPLSTSHPGPFGSEFCFSTLAAIRILLGRLGKSATAGRDRIPPRRESGAQGEARQETNPAQRRSAATIGYEREDPRPKAVG